MTPTLANYLQKEGHPMSFVDKSIKCSDCGSDFTFSAGEQESFAAKGYANDPKRCRWCRASRMVQNNASSAYSGYSQPGQPRRQMFAAVCAECGKGTDLPFEPRYGRRVYCRDCYSKVRPGALR
jgi:CxxC-x17-CxxC domain-containing protein